jgi:MarR family transcriptional regulator, organic hydroperoxide resistance regulator
MTGLLPSWSGTRTHTELYRCSAAGSEPISSSLYPNRTEPIVPETIPLAGVIRIVNQTTEPEPLHLLLAQVCKLKHARVQSLLEGLGLHRGQPAMLGALRDREGLTHTELARQLQVQPATITRMVARMERAGFLARRPDEEDQRVSRVYLTEAGRRVQADVQEVWRTLDGEAFGDLTAEEKRELGCLLLQIRDSLSRAARER